MLPYLSKKHAIAGMHERGFNNDFQLFGNDLLWVQEKIFIKTGDFSIVEYHRFFDTRTKRTDAMVFGVISHLHQVKGILLNDYASYTKHTPAIIKKKLSELNKKIMG